jgi:hypothetical protein
MVRTKLQVIEDKLKQASLVIAKHNPQDATTNPSLVLAASQKSKEVEGQLTEILNALAAESSDGEPSWRDVFSNRAPARNLQRVLLGMGPYMMNQWSGINALTVSHSPLRI